MEDNSSLNLKPVVFGPKNTDKFEEEIKSMLKWNKQEITDKGIRNARLKRLINSMKYWSKKLKPAFIDTSMIFTLYNVENNVKLEIQSLFWEIEKVDPDIKVAGYSEFRNPRYLCVYFDTKEKRDIIMNKFRMVQDSYVVYLAWALEDNLTLLKVHWLPKAIDLNLIKQEVSKYAHIISEERKNLDMLSGRPIPSGKLCFRVRMKEGISIDAVPHLTTIAQMEALVTIQGRLPLCLNCNVLGHISKKCLKRFCNRCKMLQLKEHNCNEPSGMSYAQVARGSCSQEDPDRNGFSDMEEEQEEDFGKVTDGEIGVQLQKRIKLLEEQLREKESDSGVIAKLPKKRKVKKKGLNLPMEEEVSMLNNLTEVANLDLTPIASNIVPLSVLPLVSEGEGTKLNFEGLSSLTQSPKIKKNYGISNRLTNKLIKDSLKYDPFDIDKGSVFSD